MQIIPVIDIRQQQAVQAMPGERDHYQPVNSRLCPSADIHHLVAAYLNYYCFSRIYIADLDALSNTGDNYLPIRDLLQAYPAIQLWLDAGRHDYPHRLYVDFPRRVSIVLGTETDFQLSTYQRLCHRFDCILSLDYRNGELLGSYALAELKPGLTDEIIVMCMDAVGSRNGPDLARLAALKQTGKRLFMAGGVRGYEDLWRLQQQAAAGALVGTCLHEMRLTPAEITALESSG